jgi:hypothetical protein
MYVLATPMFPFNNPHRNLENIAIEKLYENPNRDALIAVPINPINNTGLRPILSDNKPHNKLPIEYVTLLEILLDIIR